MDPMDFRRVSEAPRVMPSVSGVEGSGYRSPGQVTDSNVLGIWKNVITVNHTYFIVMLLMLRNYVLNSSYNEISKIARFLQIRGHIILWICFNSN